MTGGPDFDELVGGDLAAAERERLRRVHELLLAAGPPPELSPRLASAPPTPAARVIPLSPHRRYAAVLAAAAVVLVAFGAGWLVGARGGGDTVVRTVAMAGPHGARASLALLEMDSAGNWPMRMTVSGLPVLPHGTYALWLTKHGTLEAPCGTFTVGPGETTVRLNAPYRLKEYTGWVVVVSGSRTPLLRTPTV